MRYPWANTALLVLLAAQLATGFWGLTTGAAAGYWVLWLHGAGGYTVAALLFWKGAIVVDVFRRGRRWTAARTGFLLMAAVVLAILATGLVWSAVGPHYLAGFSLMTIHAVLALAVAFLLGWHTLAERFILRVRRSYDRRAFLRLLGVTAIGTAAWAAGRSAKGALALAGAGRRFTGSYETSSLTGQFPTVSWLFDNPAPIQAASWQLLVGGAVSKPLTLTYEQLLAMAQDAVAATLDCTGGWYSEQAWQGIAVARLLDLANVQPTARTLVVVSATGYARRFPLEVARSYLLATHVAGRPLEHGHGFPLRLVAPDQRGFNWVKWVQQLQLEESSYLWQPPLPLQ